MFFHIEDIDASLDYEQTESESSDYIFVQIVFYIAYKNTSFYHEQTQYVSSNLLDM